MAYRSTVKSGSFFSTRLAGAGLWMNRYMSTSIVDVATVLTDAPTEAVAALQYLIGGVHSFTGLNWWASIALTTLLVNGATIPFLIYNNKFLAKLLLRVPGSIELRAKLQAGDPSAPKEMMLKLVGGLFKHVCHAPLSGILFFASTIGLHGPFILYYLAITNMAEKVPSFKNGGALWFTDLTTPDAMCILPFLTALTFWVRPKVRKFQPVRDVGYLLFYGTVLSIMNFPQALYATGLPQTCSCAVVDIVSTFPESGKPWAFLFSEFPSQENRYPCEQALYCHWITSNMFMFCFLYYIKLPGVKKALGIPEKPIPGQVRKP